MGNDIQFFQTRMGKTYYETTLPGILREIHRLNDLLALLVETQLTKPEDKPHDRPGQD